MTQSDESTKDTATSSAANRTSQNSSEGRNSISDSESASKLNVDSIQNTSLPESPSLSDIRERIFAIEELLEEDYPKKASYIAAEISDASIKFVDEGEIQENLYLDLTAIMQKIVGKSDDGHISSTERDQLLTELHKLRHRFPDSENKNTKTESVEKHLERLQEKERTIEEEHKQLQELEKRLNQKETELTQIIKEISNRKEEIEDARTEAENLEAIRSQLVQWEAGDAIGGQFKERKKELRKSLWGWLFGSLVSIAILLGFSFMLYKDISNASNQGTTVLSKITLLLPVSIVVWFFVTNYSRQKQLMREYEFKESMAISFRGFLEMLREDMSEEERPQIGEFVVNTMDRIYSNPQENLSQSQQSGNQNQNQSQTGPLSQGAVAQILNRLGKK